MKICILTGEFNLFSGTSKPMYEMAKGLSKKGHEVIIITSKLNSNLKDSHDFVFKRKSKENIKIIEIKSIYKFLFYGYRHDKLNIIKIMSEADIIHGFNFLELFLAKRIIKNLKSNTKFVCTLTGPYKFYFEDFLNSGLYSLLNLLKPVFLFKFSCPNFIYRKLFNNFDKIIVNSEFILDELISLGINKKKLEMNNIKINVNEIDVFNNKKLSERYDFLYYGSGSSIRGIQDVLKAFDLLIEKFPNSILAIYLLGSHGIEEKIYKIFIKRNKNYLNNIKLHIGAEVNILDVVKQSKIIILPFRSSIGYSHPPLTILESMLLEKPVISTDIASIKEIMDNNKTGFIVKVGDIEKMVYIMQLILNENINRNIIGLQARESILTKYDEENIVDNVVKAYTGYSK